MKGDIGITLKGRELFQTKEGRKRRLFWFLTAYAMQLMVLEGLCALVITAFSMGTVSWMLYLEIALLCLVFQCLVYAGIWEKHRIYIILAAVPVYALLLFWMQESFLEGAKQAANCVIRCMNEQYESSIGLFLVGQDFSLTLFFLMVLIPVAAVFFAAVAHHSDMLVTAFLMFPLLAVILLAGGAPSAFSMLLLVLGILGLLGASGRMAPKGIWGKKKSEAYERNRVCHENVQKKTVVVLCLTGLFLAVPGYYLVRPGMDLHFQRLEEKVGTIEGKWLGALSSLLPEVSAGKWNLRLQAAEGGVSDGVLSGNSGYQIEGIEDLRLICRDKPEETLYLKGYVGNIYTGESWETTSEEDFSKAAAGWRIEEEPKLYIQNLSFLKALYVENSRGEGSAGMNMVTVERINADSRYTYYPYHAYLNEYYQVAGGDGYIAGQSLQDDVFSFYPDETYQQIMAERKEETEQGVLDRVESAYGSYVKANYMEVPEGFEELKEQCEGENLQDIEEITGYVQKLLTENYTYDTKAPATPSGEDFIHYFLYESKEGYSTHFASAGTILFRMFGVPARYVVGYAAPQNLFTIQPDGTWQAVLEDDNAHAWVEIYQEQMGWTPIEVTPGAVGYTQDIAYKGDKITEDVTLETEKEKKEKEEDSGKKILEFSGKLEGWIHILMILLPVTGVGTGVFLLWRRRRRILGLDRKKAPEQRIREIFQAYYAKLERKGLEPKTESGTEAFALFAMKACPNLKREELEHMLRLVYESCYGFQSRSEEDVEYMRRIYRKLRRGFKEKIR